MDRFISRHVQRLLLRAAFAGAVLVWTAVGPLQPDLGRIRLLLGLFLFYAAVIFAWEKGWRGYRKELAVFVYADILFAGVLIGLTGGADSEFHLLLYFIVAMRAPYLSWTQTLLIPGTCTAAYLAAVGHAGRDAHWFELLVRIGLLWFLAAVLRFMGLSSVTERQRSERLTRELSATHDDVRRYTAALEKSNAENERRLAEVTLLHRFVMQVRGSSDYERVYESVLTHAHMVCEAPWLFLVHRRASGAEGLEIRVKGTPPQAVTDLVEERGVHPDCRADGEKIVEDLGEGGMVVFHYFVRCREEGPSVALVLSFAQNQAVLLEDQIEVLSTLMDTVEMELELMGLRRDIARTNNRLVRLQDLQHELSSAFLEGGDLSSVIQEAHQIMAKELFELDRLNLFLPDPEARLLRCRTSVGIGDYPLDRIVVPMDARGGAISRAFREGRTIFFDGKGAVPEDLRLSEPYSLIPAIRSRIFVIVPLLGVRGEVLGVLGADRKHTHRPISAETVTMLEYFARHVAMVLSVHQQKEGWSG